MKAYISSMIPQIIHIIRTRGIIFVIGIALAFALVSILRDQQTPPPDQSLVRTQQISMQFSPFDGSHHTFTDAIKATLHDPESFEHVRTSYIDHAESLAVTTVFRAKNQLGAITIQTATADVSLTGEILSTSLSQ